MSAEQQFWMWSVGFRVTQSPHHWLTASHRERSGRHVQKNTMKWWWYTCDLMIYMSQRKGLIYTKKRLLCISNCVTQSYSSAACMYVTQKNIIIMINQSMNDECCCRVSAWANWPWASGSYKHDYCRGSPVSNIPIQDTGLPRQYSCF